MKPSCHHLLIILVVQYLVITSYWLFSIQSFRHIGCSVFGHSVILVVQYLPVVIQHHRVLSSGHIRCSVVGIQSYLLFSIQSFSVIGCSVFGYSVILDVQYLVVRSYVLGVQYLDFQSQWVFSIWSFSNSGCSVVGLSIILGAQYFDVQSYWAFRNWVECNWADCYRMFSTFAYLWC